MVENRPWLTVLSHVILIAGVLLARGYPLSRARHAEILRSLARRDGS